MNTIFISVYPKPNGPNVTQLCVDFNQFDPHEGVRFSVVMKNPEGLTLDRTYTNLAGEDWQDWPPEQTAQADYDYVKNVVLSNLGYTEAFAPVITLQPVSVKTTAGSLAVFSGLASGDSPLTYQWYKNQNSISGATSDTLSIISVSEADAGTYFFKAQNPVGSVYSNEVDLNLYIAPSFSINPIDVSVTSGENASFSVGVNGDMPIAFEWFKDDQAIPDSDFSQLLISGVTQDNVGVYKAKATNVAGSVYSSGASLSIFIPPPPTPIPTGDNG
jgi:hypothetical protein